MKREVTFFIYGMLVFSLFNNLSWAFKQKAQRISGVEKINKVTLFSDRAYVTRKKTVNLAKGSYRLVFAELTPFLDRDSIKVTLDEINKKNSTILSYRIIEKHFVDTSNKELKELEKERDIVKKEIKRLEKIVSDLINNQKVLSDLLAFYQESFSVKLHKKSWNKKNFKNFLSLIEKRSDSDFKDWKKVFANYLDLNKQLEFIQNQMTTQGSHSGKEYLEVEVDLDKTMKGKLSINLRYLVYNTSWKPFYDIRIDSKRKLALLEQFALVTQKSREDWRNIKLTISNMKSEIRPIPPTISSLPISWREVEKVKVKVEGVMHKEKEQKIGAVPIQTSHTELEGLFKNFKFKGKHSVPTGLANVKLFMKKGSLPYKEHLEVVGKLYPNVYRKGELKNIFPWRLLEGQVAIYYDQAFIQHFHLKGVASGAPFGINAGVDYNFNVDYLVLNKHSYGGLLKNKMIRTRTMTTEIKNYSGKKKKIRVLSQVPISEIEEVKITILSPSEMWKNLRGFPSWYYLDFELGSGQKKSVSMSMSAESPKSYGFSW